jgi:hypothetical protein
VSLARIGDAEGALDTVARGRAVAREDDLADKIVLDAAEGYARALRGERDRALEPLERAAAALVVLDTVILSTEVEKTDARARAALGDVDGARRRLELLVSESERRGMHRWSQAYGRELAALD